MYTSVCMCVKAYVIITFMYACMDSILCGPHVIRTYKFDPAPISSCASLAYTNSFLVAKRELLVFDKSSFRGDWMQGGSSHSQPCKLIVIVSDSTLVFK